MASGYDSGLDDFTGIQAPAPLTDDEILGLTRQQAMAKVAAQSNPLAAYGGTSQASAAAGATPASPAMGGGGGGVQVAPSGSPTTPGAPDEAMRTQLQNLGMRAGQDSLTAAEKIGSLATESPEEQQLSASLGTLENQRSTDQAAANKSPYIQDPNNPGKQILDPKYKPTAWQKIQRGLANLQQGGIVGAIAPGASGLTPYNAPNSQFDRERATAQAQVANDDQQLAQTNTRYKQLTDKRKAQAALLKDQTGELNATGKNASEQLGAMNRDEATQARAEAAANKIPKTYEELVAASNDPTLPAEKRQGYATAAKQIEQTEVKKFQYNPEMAGRAADRAQDKADKAAEKAQTNEADANAMVEDHLTRKQEYLDNLKPMKNGDYMDLTKNTIVKGKEVQDKVAGFRTDLNRRMAPKGFTMDAQGKIVKLGAAGGTGNSGTKPATAAAAINPQTKKAFQVGDPITVGGKPHWVRRIANGQPVLTTDQAKVGR